MSPFIEEMEEIESALAPMTKAERVSYIADRVLDHLWSTTDDYEFMKAMLEKLLEAPEGAHENESD